MLPDLGALQLRPREAPTGEFATLSRPQADELNDSGEVEPISRAEFEPSAELPPGRDYFRVRHKFQNADHSYSYTYYDAESLWEWIRTGRTLPHNRLPIWQEDWLELRQRYEPEMAIPNAVNRLPRLADAISVVEDENHARQESRGMYRYQRMYPDADPNSDEGRLVVANFVAEEDEDEDIQPVFRSTVAEGDGDGVNED